MNKVIVYGCGAMDYPYIPPNTFVANLLNRTTDLVFQIDAPDAEYADAIAKAFTKGGCTVLRGPQDTMLTVRRRDELSKLGYYAPTRKEGSA